MRILILRVEETRGEQERAHSCTYIRNMPMYVCVCVYVRDSIGISAERLGVPNLALPNGKPGVLAGLLRRPGRALEPSILHLLLHK